jgi:serine-type D-Ala-D-Ala carboxypeptidase (penicillin-binding protein 5/6)
MNFIKYPLALSLLLFNLSSFAISATAKYALLIDADTGGIIYEKNANIKMPPSSMSKLMTVYLAFDRIKNGSLQLNDKVVISKKAWSKRGSRMFLPLNKEATVSDLLHGIIIQSGNDASIAIAESIAGSEGAFVNRMNIVSKKIGLKNSRFANSTGWPNRNHYMTSVDLATLANRIIKDYPEYYNYFSQKEFTYNKIRQFNRNTLINKGLGVDGLKTGYTDDAGYGITASAERNGRRLILVLNGVNSPTVRAQEAKKLFQYGFLNFTNVKIANTNLPLISANVSLGNAEKVDLVTEKDLVFTVPIEQRNQIQAVVNYKDNLIAPVRKNEKIGTIEITLPSKETQTFALIAKTSIAEAGFFQKIYSKSKGWVGDLFSSVAKESRIKHKALSIDA